MQGDYQNAKKIFKQINEKNPTNFRSNVILGSISYKEERVDDAISYWIVARSIDPVDCPVIANLAMAYEKKGFNFIAYYYYSKYISYSINGKIDEHEVILYKMKMITKTSDINYGVGLKYQKAKNLRNAAKAYLKVLDLYPNHLNANLNMGAICYKAGKYLEAAKYWQMAFLIDEHNLANVGNIGLAYDSAKEYSYAYCFYKRFLNAQPKDETFEIMRVRTRIEEITPHAGVETASNHVRKADKFLAERNYMEALFEYENAKIINPDSADLEKKLMR
jgi:tetratricopeptide (TPR) repeat protein